MERSGCQNCGSILVDVLDLGAQPICNKFLDTPEQFGEEKEYPLILSYCPECHLVQLARVPPLDDVFGENFNYLSGATPEAVEYFERMAKTISERFDVEGGYVVDIGSSDGTFLKQFDRNVDVLGVEPAPKPCERANEEGIKTINRRFEDAIDDVLDETGRNVSVITAFNVLAHTDKIHDFLDGVERIIDECEGEVIFVSQSHYLENLIENCEYDTIYHEHARYYSLTALKNVFESHNLHIQDAEKVDYYGGSLLVYAGRHGGQSARVEEILAQEERYRDISTYREFAKNAERNANKLKNIVENMKREGKSIVGVGAPMKSSTLLNYCGIDDNILEYVTERNELKIGKYTPGSHIPVKSDAELVEDDPDVALILSWNVADRIIENLRSKGFTGSFLIPVPEPQVVE